MLRLSDRVAVLRDRHKVAELPRAEASMGQVMELIAAGRLRCRLRLVGLRGSPRSSLFWPVLALVALLVFDAVAVPGFFSLRIQDGHLYGSLVDILKNGAPTALIALGMTLVIATRGIDLSVGATVAISGAVACGWIAGGRRPDQRERRGRRRAARARASRSCSASGTGSWSRCWASSRSSPRWCS